MSLSSLPMFLKLAGQPVILMGDGEMAAAKRRLLERAGAVVVAEEGDARIAIVALEDDAEARAAVGRLKARGLLVNAVDRPALCDFTMPAIVDRDPVIVAIGTAGTSAGLAKALRERMEGWLPASLGTLADAMKARRGDIVARWPDATQRRHAIDAAMAAGGALDPFGPAAQGLDPWLSGADARTPGDSVEIVLASDDPDDMTLKQARMIAQADRIVHGVDVPNAILNRARADAVRVADNETVSRQEGFTVHITMAR